MANLGLLIVWFLWSAKAPCDDQAVTTGGQAVILLGMLANILFQWKSAERQRKWQVEDAERLVKKTEDTAKILAKKTEDTAEKLKQSTQEALNAQTEELRTGMRTRISDLGRRFDEVLKAEQERKRDEQRTTRTRPDPQGDRRQEGKDRSGS